MRKCVHTYMIRDMTKKTSVTVIYLKRSTRYRTNGWVNEWEIKKA